MKIWLCGTKQSTFKKVYKYPIFHYSPSYDFHWFVVCHFCAWNYMNVFRMKSHTVCVVQYTTWTRAKMLVEKNHCNFFLKKSLDLFREIQFYCCGTVCTVPPFCVVCECSLMQCANSYPSLSFTFCRNNFLLVVRVECIKVCITHSHLYFSLLLVWWPVHKHSWHTRMNEVKTRIDQLYIYVILYTVQKQQGAFSLRMKNDE